VLYPHKNFSKVIVIIISLLINARTVAVSSLGGAPGDTIQGVTPW